VLTIKPNPSNLRLIAKESTAELVNKILQRPGDSALVTIYGKGKAKVVQLKYGAP